MNERKHGSSDEPFEADLRALSASYRDIAPEQPPQAMDEALRAAARRAVLARPRRSAGLLHWAGLSRWAGPVAIAAVLVFTISVSWLAVVERPDLSPIPTQQVMKPRPGAVPDTQDSDLAEPNRALSKGNSSTAEQDSGEAKRDSGESQARITSASPPVPAAAQESAARTNRGKPRVAKSLAAAPAEEKSPQAESNSPSVAGALTPSQTAAPEALHSTVPPQRDAIDQAPAVPAAQRAPTDSTADSTATKSTAGGASVYQAPAGPLNPRHTMRQSPAVNESNAAAEAPDAWLRRIALLREGGKRAEADTELDRFKRRYPDYPLPPELRSAR